MEGIVPQIKVSVKVGEKEATHIGAHFIDAISFLCQCEDSIRRSRNATEPVDIQTVAIQKENMKKLLGG